MASSTRDQLTPSKVGPRGPDPAKGVYYKLAFFSVALFAAPISAYYLSRERLFDGNPTYAGGLAAVVANLVLVGYIIAAFLEDEEGENDKKRGKERREEIKTLKEETKKQR